MSAKLNRKVIAFEPFIDNIYRIHKAAQLENLTNNIVLVQNAVSNKRNEVALMSKKDLVMAAQGIFENKGKKFKRDSRDKYQVETIVLDDVIPYLPKRDDGTEFERAAMKIDIEGFEPFAMQKASKLFDHLDVRIILMEWKNLATKNNYQTVDEMIHFKQSRG